MAGNVCKAGAEARSGTGPFADHFSRTCHPDGFFRKFSAERARLPTGVLCVAKSLVTQRPRVSHREGVAAAPSWDYSRGLVSLHSDRSTAQRFSRTGRRPTHLEKCSIKCNPRTTQPLGASVGREHY